MNHSSSGQRQLQKPRLLQLLVWNGLEPFKLPRLSLDAIRAPGFFEGSSQAARGGGKLSVFISEESRLSLDAIRALGFWEGPS